MAKPGQHTYWITLTLAELVTKGENLIHVCVNAQWAHDQSMLFLILFYITECLPMVPFGNKRTILLLVITYLPKFCWFN